MALVAVSIKAHGKSKSASKYDVIVDKEVTLHEGQFELKEGNYGVNARFIDQDGCFWFASLAKGVECEPEDAGDVCEISIQIRKASKDYTGKLDDGGEYTIKAGDHKAYVTAVQFPEEEKVAPVTEVE